MNRYIHGTLHKTISEHLTCFSLSKHCAAGPSYRPAKLPQVIPGDEDTQGLSTEMHSLGWKIPAVVGCHIQRTRDLSLHNHIPFYILLQSARAGKGLRMKENVSFLQQLPHFSPTIFPVWTIFRMCHGDLWTMMFGGVFFPFYFNSKLYIKVICSSSEGTVHTFVVRFRLPRSWSEQVQQGLRLPLFWCWASPRSRAEREMLLGMPAGLLRVNWWLGARWGPSWG